jgi:hypothetical protein
VSHDRGLLVDEVTVRKSVRFAREPKEDGAMDVERLRHCATPFYIFAYSVADVSKGTMTQVFEAARLARAASSSRSSPFAISTTSHGSKS